MSALQSVAARGGTGDDATANSDQLMSDHSSIGDDGVLWNDNDAVTNVVQRMVHLVGLAFGADRHVVADARILVDDGVFDACVLTDSKAREGSGRVGLNRG